MLKYSSRCSKTDNYYFLRIKRTVGVVVEVLVDVLVDVLVGVKVLWK